MLFKYSRLYEITMYCFNIIVYEHGIEFEDTIWADNSRDAIECGYEMYPDADWIDII